MIPLGWSIGDLLTAIGTIKIAIKALDESKGAKADFQDLMKDLYNLERVLLAIQRLNITDPSNPEHDALQQAIRECRDCVDKFLKETEKYQSLTSGPSNLKDQARKVKWALLHQDDVRKFRESLAKRTASLNLLLSICQLSHSVSSEAKTEDRFNEQTRLLGEVEARISASDAEQLQLLRQIEDLLRKQVLVAPETQAEISKYSVRPFKLNGAPLAPAFVQRPEIMHAMEDQLLPISKSQQTILVLQGMGGIGKSQMAREYATTHQDAYIAVFWVNAKSENSLKIGIAEIAVRVGLDKVLDEGHHLAKDEDSIAVAIKAVHEWFGEDENTDWLLILDNVDSQVQPDIEEDEAQESQSPGTFDASQYIPSTSHGTLLMTSRLSYLARSMGGISYTIDQMTTKEGLEVICKLSGRIPHEPGKYQESKRPSRHVLQKVSTAWISNPCRRASGHHSTPNVAFQNIHRTCLTP